MAGSLLSWVMGSKPGLLQNSTIFCYLLLFVGYLRIFFDIKRIFRKFFIKKVPKRNFLNGFLSFFCANRSFLGHLSRVLVHLSRYFGLLSSFLDTL